MEWVQVIIDILEIVAIIILGLLLKNYYPDFTVQQKTALRLYY